MSALVWVTLLSEPTRVFAYDAADVEDHIPAGTSAMSALTNIGTLRSDSDGETANLTIALSNRSGVLTRMFAVPPIGRELQVNVIGAILFRGVVKSVNFSGEDCMLGVNA